MSESTPVRIAVWLLTTGMWGFLVNAATDWATVWVVLTAIVLGLITCLLDVIVVAILSAVFE